jgi:hypothetical protein
MKTAFALAFLAVNAHATAVTGVTGEWKTHKHLDDNALQICATHTTVVPATGVVTYQYSGATCTAGTTAAELVWKTAADATAPAALKAVCVMTPGKVVCTGTNSDSMAITASEQSCVKLLKCRPTADATAAATDFKVFSSADTTAASPNAVVKFAANPVAITLVKPATDNAKVGAAEFDLEFKVDPTASIADTKVVTVVAPGYTQAVGGTCKFEGKTATAATTADPPPANGWTFTVPTGGASGTAEIKLICTKVKVSATAAMAASKFAVIWGNDVNSVTEAGFVASPAIAKADTTTKAPTGSASTTSLSAAALLLAASMYL